MRRASYIESGIKTADALIYTGAVLVYSMTLSWKGVTVGDLCTLIDGTDVTGHDEVAFVFPTANGTLTKEWAQGKLFDTGLFFNKGGMAPAGAVFADFTYQANL